MSKKKGKPQAINRERMEAICNLIRCGNYVKTSVKACGVNYNTYLDYMKKGKKGISPYDEYYEMQEQAKAEFESGAITSITDSGKEGNIGAYMWLLPRMYPQRWGKTQRQEIKVDNSQRIELVRVSDVQKEDKSKEE